MEKSRIQPIKLGDVVRMSYSRIDEVLEMPNLLALQKDSYDWFLEEGLKEVFEDISPITDHSNNLILEFIGFKLDSEPRYSIAECKERDATYAAALRVKTRLTNKKDDEIKEQESINDKSGSITCSLYSKDVVNNYELTSTYIINYTGEFVDSVNTKEVVDSDVSSILDTLEETLNSTYSASNDVYGGYTYKITRSDNEIISDVFIDYKKMDLEQFVTDQPVLKSYMKDGKLTVEGIKSIYTSMGATCE